MVERGGVRWWSGRVIGVALMPLLHLLLLQLLLYCICFYFIAVLYLLCVRYAFDLNFVLYIYWCDKHWRCVNCVWLRWIAACKWLLRCVWSYIICIVLLLHICCVFVLNYSMYYAFVLYFSLHFDMHLFCILFWIVVDVDFDFDSFANCLCCYDLIAWASEFAQAQKQSIRYAINYAGSIVHGDTQLILLLWTWRRYSSVLQ